MMLSSMNLSAQVDTQDIGSASIEPPAAAVDGEQFKIDVSADFIGAAKVEKSCLSGHVTFATGQVEVNGIFYYDPCYKEGAAAAIAYQQTYLDWNKNPYFSQRNYETLSLILSTYTERLFDWQWRAQISINFDDLPYWNFGEYMNYDMLAWGRYEWSECVGVHIGFFAQTGMKMDRVYPIVGFDWQINEAWKLNLVYPVNISAVYTINPEWTVALAARFIDQRHRTKEDEPVPEAVWHYQGCGGELAINYLPTKTLSFNLHAGCFAGGHLAIYTHHYHRLERLRDGAAPYAGGEIVYHF